MTKPDASVVTALIDAADDHLTNVEHARARLARSATRVTQEFRLWQEELAAIDAHAENAAAALEQIRALRPSIRGRRSDLKAAA